MQRFRRVDGESPRIYGHRGASQHAPENTMRAFERALEGGADGVEFDVRLSGSGELVVFHDRNLERLCGDKRRIGETPLADLRAVRIAGEPIPTLDEVLDWAGDGILLNVEVKAEAGGVRRIGSALAERLQRRGLERAENVLVSSFHPVALGSFIAGSPLPTALLYHAGQPFPLRRAWAAPWLGVDGLHPDRRIALGATARSVAGLRLRYVLNIWTVDDPDEIRRLATLGVDGIITNDPAAARAALA